MRSTKGTGQWGKLELLQHLSPRAFCTVHVEGQREHPLEEQLYLQEKIAAAAQP